MHSRQNSGTMVTEVRGRGYLSAVGFPGWGSGETSEVLAPRSSRAMHISCRVMQVARSKQINSPCPK